MGPTTQGTAVLWFVGVIVLVLMLEFEPKVGGWLLLLVVAVLALKATRKGY